MRRARELAHGLGMAHLSIDLRAEFRAGVIEPWIADHAAGDTPNPCIRCNGSVRLDAMLALAERLGSRVLATGHYARVLEEPSPAEGPLLRMAADEAKDQSYVLSALSPRSLARLRFPLGELSKAQVRELAARAGLAVARRRDSRISASWRARARAPSCSAMGARPAPGRDRRRWRAATRRARGRAPVHRRSAPRAGRGRSRPLYVLATDAQANTVTVGPREALLDAACDAREVTLHRDGDASTACACARTGAAWRAAWRSRCAPDATRG